MDGEAGDLHLVCVIDVTEIHTQASTVDADPKTPEVGQIAGLTVEIGVGVPVKEGSVVTSAGHVGGLAKEGIPCRPNLGDSRLPCAMPFTAFQGIVIHGKLSHLI